MRHHIQKAVQIYAEKGLISVAKSAMRFAPIEMNNLVFALRHGAGTRVMEEDWDTLLILDACRYDMFAKQVPFPGKLESRISLGSSSEEFFEQNFMGGKYNDSVYVNSNPYLPYLGLDRGVFHAVVDCLDEWDPDLRTIPPERVASATEAARERFPNKRLIVHFMQPHAPFIGETGLNLVGEGLPTDPGREREQVIWEHLDSGDVDVDAVWRAYRENLDVVFWVVETLVKSIDGKTVITSDHGNLVGERLGPIPTRKKYGHPYGVRAPGLVRVPWFTIDSGERRLISADPSIESDTISKSTIDYRLEALGYR